MGQRVPLCLQVMTAASLRASSLEPPASSSPTVPLAASHHSTRTTQSDLNCQLQTAPLLTDSLASATMLARQTLCHLAAEVPKPRPHHLHQLARFLRPALCTRNAAIAPAVQAISRAHPAAQHVCRSYATAARAKKPVKRTTTTTAKKAVTAKPKAATKTATKRTAKPAAKKKAAAAKKPVRKTAGKKRVAKKRVAKKPVKKKPVKKVLTPEAKEKAVLRALRKKALRAPVLYSQVSGLNQYVADTCSGPNKGGGSSAATLKVTEATKNWKNLTPAQQEVTYKVDANADIRVCANGLHSITTILPMRKQRPGELSISPGSTATLPMRSDSPTTRVPFCGRSSKGT